MWEWFANLPMIVVVVIFVVAILGVGTLVWYVGFERPIQDAKRAAIKGSHAYIEATQSRLLKYATEYETVGAQILQYEAAQKQGQGDFAEVIKGMRSQKAALLQQIKDESQRISEDEVPESVKKILKQEEIRDETQDSPSNIGTSTSLAWSGRL